jgi:hypothetical protein
VQKVRLSTLERIFVLIAVITVFTVTVYYMSTDGILPGNDPAVHIGKAEKIVTDERVTYSAVPWYPPLFHAVLAVLQIFSGTLDVIVAAFILKMLIATLNVLIMLSTYLLTRKLFGKGAAVATAVFVILSVPLIEMVFWGGYANFLGLAYIAFIFYIMNKELQVTVKTFLLFLGAFTIVLSHQLATFVFVLMFIPAFLFSTIGSKKRLLVLLGLIVGGGLALLAWYARILLANTSAIIEHLFFTMEENVYNIPEVGLDALIRNNFGVSLFLALASIPLTCILFKKKSVRALILVILWIAIPFIMSQSYLFGLYLPYIRFVYFFAIPITILAGTFTYTVFRYSFTSFPRLINSIISNITRKHRILKVTTIISLTIVSLALIITLFLFQGVFFVERNESYPKFYARASIASYNAGLWIKQHSTPDGTIVTSRSPGTWFNLFSNDHVMEETNPLYSRNAVAESVLYSFYEMENTHTLTREYTQASPSAGQALFVQIYNIWWRGISIPNNETTIIYVDSFGENVTIPLSETNEHIYWKERTADEAQLVSEYTHELFTVEKTIVFLSNSSVIDVRWKIEAHQYLACAKLAFANNLSPSLDFKAALVPGVLNWENPWDNATYINIERKWAVVEGPSDMLNENVAAIYDAQNKIEAVFEFPIPDWFILGALDNRLIDAFRLRYEFGDLGEGETREIVCSYLLHASDFEEIEQMTASDLRKQLNSTVNLQIQERDFRSYIEEYNIKFVVIDTQQVLSGTDASPDLDRVLDNGRAIVYTTKR